MTWMLYAIVSWGRSKFTEAKNDRKVEFCPESTEHRFEVSVCEGPNQTALEPGCYKESRGTYVFRGFYVNNIPENVWGEFVWK